MQPSLKPRGIIGQNPVEQGPRGLPLRDESREGRGEGLAEEKEQKDLQENQSETEKTRRGQQPPPREGREKREIPGQQ